MEISKSGYVNAFAVIVDINHFTRMVKDSEGNGIAQFVRDVLNGGIEAVEKEQGEVVGFMGDAFLALLHDAESFVRFAIGTAKDLDNHCEYISRNQAEASELWDFANGGASLKIMAEHGTLNVSEIRSRALGVQKLFIGDAINYAARLGAAGEGNRCLLGPAAAKLVEEAGYGLEGPSTITGKGHEGDFEYYEFDLGDAWKPGKREPGEDTFLG
jgi:class 3 adenylate cyclase